MEIRKALLILSVAVAFISFYNLYTLNTISGSVVTQLNNPASSSSPPLVEIVSTAPPLVENVSIVFLGDSISRFAYISLAYFLHTGEWLHPSISHDDARASPHDGKSYKILTKGDLKHAWNVFQNMTNELIQDEICDCGKFDARYYQDDRNNRVIHFFRSGHHKQAPFKSRINPQEIWGNFTAKRGVPFGLEGKGEPFFLIFDWAEMIRTVIGKMNPIPENLVLSAALWPNRFDELEIRQNITIAAKEIGIKRVLWRTGTTIWQGTRAGIVYKAPGAKLDPIMCDFVGKENCIDLSFMNATDRSFYSSEDHKHFREPVNRLMNEETLAVLGYLPKGYKRLNQSIILHPYDEVEMNKSLESLL